MSRISPSNHRHRHAQLLRISHQETSSALGWFVANNMLLLLPLISSKLHIPTVKSLPGPPPFENVEIRQGGEIFSSASDAPRGSIRSRHAQLLELFRTEHIDMDLGISSTGSSTNTASRQLVLQVILYGEKDLSDSLKEVLRSQDLFLQDPYGASRDVVYWNPQRYCNPPGVRTSDFYSTKDSQKTIVEQVDHVDSLAAFTSRNDMTETEPSSHVRTSLKPYAYPHEYTNSITHIYIGTRNKHCHS